jgi:hypothetical protein
MWLCLTGYFLSVHGSPTNNLARSAEQAASSPVDEETAVTSSVDKLTLVHDPSTEGPCQPTTSTYGWFATVATGCLNYHVEHHDFPAIPWCRLPRVRATAPEFYEPLRSWGGFHQAILSYLKEDGGSWRYACR